jgi:hypothetical protein
MDVAIGDRIRDDGISHELPARRKTDERGKEKRDKHLWSDERGSVSTQAGQQELMISFNIIKFSGTFTGRELTWE